MAEFNYNVGNRKLLAIKWAFEECRQWLDGAKFPLVVYTNHTNLVYIESPKILNPRQTAKGEAKFAMLYLPASLQKLC